MPETVTVPDVLHGHAATIWREAFLSSYDGTCKDRSDRDGCAAAIGWSAVEQKYHKNKDGEWVQKAEDAAMAGVSGMSSGEYPQPMMGARSPKWMAAYDAALLGECAKAVDPAVCASAKADAAVKGGEEEPVSRTMRLHRNDYGDLSLPLVICKDYSPEKRAEYAEKGWALPDGSYPIADMGDLRDAIQSFGRAGNKNEVKAHIRMRAKALGALDEVSEEWGGEEEKSLVAMSATERRRHEEALADQAMLDQGLADKVAVRPDSMNSNDWMRRPIQQRTVGALIIERAVARSYEAAVEHCAEGGWQPIVNPTRKDEFIFQRWLDSPDGPILQRTVLVRKSRTINWKLRELTRGAAMSLAVQIPSDERRYGDPRF